MKKEHVLKTLSKLDLPHVTPLSRKKAYVIRWHHTTMVIQITHFHKTGIVFRALSQAPGYREITRTGKILYGSISSHKFKEATLADILCHMGTGTHYMSDYMSDTKTLLKHHSQDL